MTEIKSAGKVWGFFVKNASSAFYMEIYPDRACPQDFFFLNADNHHLYTFCQNLLKVCN